MDPTDPLFSRIPREVLLLIVKQLPGLPSVRNVDKASPMIASLFDEFGPEIVESIISTNLPTQVQSLIRIIILIDSNKILTPSLEEFTAAYLRRDGYCENFVEVSNHGFSFCIRRLHPSLENSCKVCEDCTAAFPPIRISQDIPSFILRKVLDTASRIQNLTDGLLQSCLNRCLALNPLQFSERFQYLAVPNNGRRPQRRPVGKPFRPESSSHFSWTERQRSSRHFWRVQLFFHLKLRSRDLHWPIEDLARLNSLDIFSFWELHGLPKRLKEQLGTIVDCLASTGHQNANDTFCQGTAAHALNQISIASLITRETWEVPSFYDSHRLDKETEAGFIVRDVIGNHRCLNSPLRYINFENWRKFGFYIWDDERMQSLGFLFRTTDLGDIMSFTQSFSKPDMWFRWESILSYDIIEANERRRIAAFPDRCRDFDATGRRETWWST